MTKKNINLDYWRKRLLRERVKRAQLAAHAASLNLIRQCDKERRERDGLEIHEGRRPGEVREDPQT